MSPRTAEHDQYDEYVTGQVARVERRERMRQVRLTRLRTAARAAAEALRDRYGEGITVYMFGSVADEGRFRLDSDLDLAVTGVEPERYYEAWSIAEAAARAAGSDCVDLVALDDAPAWLVEEIVSRGVELG
ncbi:MAG TPA: nucleotidyltransferase domain-containing protein [Longimicrobiales bacterium]|nr:nucleotidyltransferase domain-containing protein [Longimicrobiales bacterium]